MRYATSQCRSASNGFSVVFQYANLLITKLILPSPFQQRHRRRHQDLEASEQGDYNDDGCCSAFLVDFIDKVVGGLSDAVRKEEEAHAANRMLRVEQVKHADEEKRLGESVSFCVKMRRVSDVGHTFAT